MVLEEAEGRQDTKLMIYKNKQTNKQINNKKSTSWKSLTSWGPTPRGMEILRKVMV